MKSNELIRLYDRLTAAERLRLVLQAMLREDHEEKRRLEEACPRKTYTMVDAEFHDLYDCSQLAAANFAMFWLDASHRVTCAQLEKGAVHRAGMAFDRGLGVGLQATKRIPNEDHPIWEASREQFSRYDMLREEANRRYREAVARLKGGYAGFLRFCRAAGVEPDELLAWRKALRAEIAEMRDLLEGDIPANDEVAETVYRTLCESWPGLDTKEGDEGVESDG